MNPSVMLGQNSTDSSTSGEEYKEEYSPQDSVEDVSTHQLAHFGAAASYSGNPGLEFGYTNYLQYPCLYGYAAEEEEQDNLPEMASFLSQMAHTPAIFSTLNSGYWPTLGMRPSVISQIGSTYAVPQTMELDQNFWNNGPHHLSYGDPTDSSGSQAYGTMNPLISNPVPYTFPSADLLNGLCYYNNMEHHTAAGGIQQAQELDYIPQCDYSHHQIPAHELQYHNLTSQCFSGRNGLNKMSDPRFLDQTIDYVASGQQTHPLVGAEGFDQETTAADVCPRQKAFWSSNYNFKAVLTSKFLMRKARYGCRDATSLSRCNLCGNFSTAKASRGIKQFMKWHLYSHINKDPYYCRICGKCQTTNPGKVRGHIKKRHPEQSQFLSVNLGDRTPQFDNQLCVLAEQCYACH